MGLAIVDKIARVLDHRIRVRSIFGRGSLFAVEVPITDAAMLQVAPQTEGLSHSSLQNHPVLVLDNDPNICEGMERLLDGWGMDVMTALNRQEACALLDDGLMPDLLLVDYHLDNDEIGVDIAQEINQRLEQPIPVIVITANYSKALNTEIQSMYYQRMNKPIKPM